MEESNSSNKSKYHYFRISKLVYLLGAPNYWYEEFEIPEFVKKIHDPVVKFIDLILCIFLASQTASFFTQHNLNEKQEVDRTIYALCLPLLYFFVHTVSYDQEKVRDVAYNLAVNMKELYNDEEVEKHMIRQVKRYYMLFGFFSLSTMLMYGVNGALQVFYKGATFVTVVTAWPDVDDTSMIAGVVRVIVYILWWICMVRIHSTSYVVAILISISLSHQFKNLCSYFYSIQNIFQKQGLSHEEKEREYEKAFRVGIQLHSNTLRCTKLTQKICNFVFSIQIIVNVTVLLFLMVQMVNSERTLANTATIVVMTFCLLTSTGCLWWNAGDITVEASYLSTAMFHSGWHHCRGEAAQRIRHLLVISMWQSQRPVELQCLGVVQLSYQSYVTIVKTSYSLFSVLY